MNIDYIKARVGLIENVAMDAEQAHSYEDQLHVKFIRYIAENDHNEYGDMAREILMTEKLDFPRWCA